MSTLDEFTDEVTKSFFPLRVDQQIYVDVIARIAAEDNERSAEAVQLALKNIHAGKSNLGQIFLSLSVKAGLGKMTQEEKELLEECETILRLMSSQQFPACPVPLPYVCFLVESELSGAVNQIQVLQRNLTDFDKHATFLLSKWRELCPKRPLIFDMNPKIKLSNAYAKTLDISVINQQVSLFAKLIGCTLQIVDVNNEMNHFWHAKRIVEMIVTKSSNKIEEMPDLPNDKRKELLAENINKLGKMYVKLMTEICQDISLTEIIHVLSRNEKDSFSSFRTVDNGTFIGLLNEFAAIPDPPPHLQRPKYPLVPPSAWRYSTATRLYDVCLKTEFALAKILEIEGDMERKLSIIVYLGKELNKIQDKVFDSEYLSSCEKLLAQLQ